MFLNLFLAAMGCLSSKPVKIIFELLRDIVNVYYENYPDPQTQTQPQAQPQAQTQTQPQVQPQAQPQQPIPPPSVNHQ